MDETGTDNEGREYRDMDELWQLELSSIIAATHKLTSSTTSSTSPAITAKVMTATVPSPPVGIAAATTQNYALVSSSPSSHQSSSSSTSSTSTTDNDSVDETKSVRCSPDEWYRVSRESWQHVAPDPVQMVGGWPDVNTIG
jgi:hypothetical protein